MNNQATHEKETAAIEPRATPHHIWWQLLTLVIVSTGAVLAGMSFDQQLQKYLPEPKTLASVFNKKPSGLSGIMEIAQSTGLICKQWLLPYRQLASINGMLVIVAPSESLAEFETEQILNWVKKGNDLVYLDHFAFKFTRRLLQKIDVDAKEGEELIDRHLPVNANLPEFAHVKELMVSADTRLVGGQPVLTDKSGTLLTEVSYGRGRILIGTVPSLVSNRRLADTSDWQNFQFLINWLRTTHGAVYFDERCHGFYQTGNVFVFLARSAVGVTFLQIMLILAVAVASAAQRFGKQEALDDKRKISSMEFILGLANTYRRARANTAALEIIGQTFRNRLCKALGVSPHESDSTVVQAFKASSFATAPHSDMVVKYFEDYEQALLRKHISDEQLKTLIWTCDKITEQSTGLFTTTTTPQNDGANV